MGEMGFVLLAFFLLLPEEVSGLFIKNLTKTQAFIPSLETDCCKQAFDDLKSFKGKTKYELQATLS